MRLKIYMNGRFKCAWEGDNSHKSRRRKFKLQFLNLIIIPLSYFMIGLSMSWCFHTQSVCLPCLVVVLCRTPLPWNSPWVRTPAFCLFLSLSWILTPLHIAPTHLFDYPSKKKDRPSPISNSLKSSWGYYFLSTHQNNSEAHLESASADPAFLQWPSP